MAKLRLYGCTVLLLLATCLKGYSQYTLRVNMQSPDSILSPAALGIPASFKNREDCTDYIYKLPGLLQDKGFAASSIDSIRFDSASAFLQLYTGDRFSWSSIKIRPEDADLLRAAGWNTKKLMSKPARLDKVQAEELRLLDYLENNGYPFARITLDSIGFERGSLSAIVNIEKGPRTGSTVSVYMAPPKSPLPLWRDTLAFRKAVFTGKTNCRPSANEFSNFLMFRKNIPGM